MLERTYHSEILTEDERSTDKFPEFSIFNGVAQDKSKSEAIIMGFAGCS